MLNLLILNQPKGKYVDLSLSNINTSDCNTVGDCVRKIVDHASQNKSGVIAPLGSLIAQMAREGENTEIGEGATGEGIVRMTQKRKSFWELAGWDDATSTEETIKSSLENILKQNQDGIEAQKDKLNFAPTIEFTEKHIDIYHAGLSLFLQKDTSKIGELFAKNIEVRQFEGGIDTEIQLTPDECRSIIARMPRVLQQISSLATVSYDYMGVGYRIHLPLYMADGEFAGLSQAVKPEDFPRKQGNTYSVYGWNRGDNGWNYEGSQITQEQDDHPTRVLVGITHRDGHTIYPSALPKELSAMPSVIKSYQIGVFIHEFFHTLKNKSAKLSCDGQEFTFGEWLRKWEELILSGLEPKFVSYYAATYANKLNSVEKDKNDGKFDWALMEQICESFVAYILNIQANPDGWTDFKSESFGNTEQQAKYQRGESLAANQKWLLMDKLCRATIIS